jgi:choline dehydrogenase
MSHRDAVGHPNVVIVGGGSAGAVLAARLSEDPSREVLLVEAGHSYPPDEYPAPVADVSTLGPFTASDWGYTAEPGYVGHPIPLFRGKVIGGSSAVNGSVAVRALPADFTRWSAHRINGWTYAEVIGDYVRLERTDVGDDALHGSTGPFPIHQLTRAELSETQNAFLDAAQAVGLPVNDDFNDAVRLGGVGPLPKNVIDGVRINTGMAYLTAEVRGRENLTIRPDSEVDRVILTGSRVVGVALVDWTVIDADEVILSAGSYGSPAILLRSGIGPAVDLAALGIDVVTDLPVGRRLREHPTYYNAYAVLPEKAGAQLPLIGPLAWASSSYADADDPDIHINATHLFLDPSQSPTGIGFVLAPSLVRPTSVGSLTLASRDPQAAPRVDLNLLAEADDRARLIEGIRLAREIGRTAPLAEFFHSELTPGATAMSDAEIEAAMLATIDIYHHPTSTAPMGGPQDPHAVVDELGRVYSIDGLRVVDASMFPDPPSVATGLTVIMAAEHIARLAYRTAPSPSSDGESASALTLQV